MIEEKTAASITLADAVSRLVACYLESMGNAPVVNLHDRLMAQIEPPLLKAVMETCKYNQSRAAKTLGISRITCRTLLIKYFDRQYCGRRTIRDKA